MPENANTIQTSTNLVKMAGYLEKRGKLGMMGTRWRRWWCVLEGRLLLYYKSQNEYSNLSPCRGSLNMGLAASVTPARNFQLHVTTRSQLCVLKARNQIEQERWLQALLDSMSLVPPIQSHNATIANPTLTKALCKPVQHFRYSSKAREKNSPSKTAQTRGHYDSSNPSYLLMEATRGTNPFEEMEMKDEKVKRLSYQDLPQQTNKHNRYSESFVNGVIELDENFNLNSRNERDKNETFNFGHQDKKRAPDLDNEHYMNLVNDTLTKENGGGRILKVTRADKTKYPSDFVEKSKVNVKPSRHFSSVPEKREPSEKIVDLEKIKTRNNLLKEKKVSLQDCRLRIRSDMNLYTDPMGSVERLFTGIGKDTRITRRKSNEIKESFLKMRSISDACLLKSIYDDTMMPFEIEHKKSRSKTDLVSKNSTANAKSKSCENVFLNFKLVDSNLSSDSSLETPRLVTRRQKVARDPGSNPCQADSTTRPRRTDSFLKRLMTPSPKGVVKVDSVKKRSFSFFHKLVTKRKMKETSSNRGSVEEEVTSDSTTLGRNQLSTGSDESFNSSSGEHQIYADKDISNPSFKRLPSPDLETAPQPEPRPDYDEDSSDNESIELNNTAPEPPSHQATQPKSPDSPNDNESMDCVIPPPLPLKLKRHSQNQHPNYVNFILPAQLNYSDSLEGALLKPDFDDIISKNKKIDSEEIIYDVPRPHAALSLILRESSLDYSFDTEPFTSDFRDTIEEPDSLDVPTQQIFITETENCLTPDSLEINWCMKKAESWISSSFGRDIFHFGADQYHDSLDFDSHSQNHFFDSRSQHHFLHY